MELYELLGRVVLLVVLLIVVTGVISFDRAMLRRLRTEFRERVRIALPFLTILGIVLLFNAQFRNVVHNISWAIGINITPGIHGLEGRTIVSIQQFFGEGFAHFFSYIYVYGYVFLLVFPLIAYFMLDRMDVFKSMTLAYAANYGIGLLCYVIFVAYGPRNIIPMDVEGLLLPQFQLLTTEVNENTNVFPSLHTSLSATVMLFAWHTRERFPAWVLIAWFLGISIIISTMYLGIHWALDVLAGLGLAGFSYWMGMRIVERRWIEQLEVGKHVERFRAVLR